MTHKLTVAEQVRGLEKALRSPRTPSHLRPFIRKRLRVLKPEMERERERTKTRRRRKPGLLDWLGL
jgi:hypothetical protein